MKLKISGKYSLRINVTVSAQLYLDIEADGNELQYEGGPVIVLMKYFNHPNLAIYGLKDQKRIKYQII
jgi:hypothetical protein